MSLITTDEARLNGATAVKKHEVILDSDEPKTTTQRMRKGRLAGMFRSLYDRLVGNSRHGDDDTQQRIQRRLSQEESRRKSRRESRKPR